MKENNLKLHYMEDTYEKLTVLGSNEENPVWLAKHRYTGQIVVWKRIELLGIPLYTKLKEMKHPGLVCVREVIRLDECGIVIEDYVSGITLEEMLCMRRCLEKPMVDDYMKQLFNVLLLIHREGIVHRDINPKNILISTDGVLKLIDFGIAREEKEARTKDTTILGTVGYAPPEQFGFRQTDARTDIYACGVLMNVLLTGELVSDEVTTEKPYRNVILKCVQMDPQMRYQNIGEMYAALYRVNSRRLNTSNTVPPLNHDKKNTSIVPGFRSGVTWKMVLAVIFYVFFGTYSVVNLFEVPNSVGSFLLIVLAHFIYIWIPFLLLTDFWYFDRKLYPFRKWNRAVNITLRILISLFLFYWGVLLESFVRYDMLGLPGK